MLSRLSLVPNCLVCSSLGLFFSPVSPLFQSFLSLCPPPHPTPFSHPERNTRVVSLPSPTHPTPPHPYPAHPTPNPPHPNPPAAGDGSGRADALSAEWARLSPEEFPGAGPDGVNADGHIDPLLAFAYDSVFVAAAGAGAAAAVGGAGGNLTGIALDRYVRCTGGSKRSMLLGGGMGRDGDGGGGGGMGRAEGRRKRGERRGEERLGRGG